MELNSIHSFFHQAYMPRGHCYLWQPHLLLTNVISDLLIATAYFSIPIAIIIFKKKRTDIGNHWLFVLFSSFITLCGITHLIGIYTVWHGAYGIHGISKALTAIVSIVTALYLFRLIPNAIAIPTPSQFFGVKDKLSKLTTEQEQLKLLLEQQKASEFILENMPVSMLLLDKSHKIMKCNKHFLKELNYKDASAILSTDLSQHMQFDDPLCDLNTLIQGARRNHKKAEAQLCHVISRDGNSIPMDIRLLKSSLEQEELILIVFNNLSSYKKLERQLDDSHDRIERAVKATEDGVWEWDIKNDSVTYSSTLMKMIGKEHLKSPTYLDWYEHIHPDYRSKVEEAIKKHFETKQRLQVEYLGRNKDGTYAWFMAIANSQFDQQGNASIMSGAVRYIQDSKQLESQVAEKTNILNCLFDGTNQAIWLLRVEPNSDFTYLQFNAAACERSNVQSEDIINKRLSSLANTVFPDHLVKKLSSNYALCAESKQPIEYVESLPFNDEQRWYQTTLYPILDQHNKVEKIVGTAIDITARKYAELELDQNRAFLEQIINSAVCGLYLYDIEKQKNTRINRRYTDLLGYTILDLQETTLIQLIHPEDKQRVQTHMEEVFHSKEQQLLPVEYRIKHKDGDWRWCSAVDTVISRDEHHAPKILLGTFVDITEKAQLLLQLQTSNDNLEHFAFLASHDLQEPLRKITAFTDSLSVRLSEYLQSDAKAQFEMSRLIEAASRMRTMIQDLLKLSRLQTQKIKQLPTTLGAIFDNACDQVSCSIEEHTAKIEIKNRTQVLLVDPSLFVQVFQNLISNSLKFSSTERAPEITISSEIHNNKVHLYYQDNGIGIEQTHWQSVFEPFKRLNNSKSSGNGIGLAICKEIIKLHEGEIQCRSNKEEGTIFTIILPNS